VRKKFDRRAVLIGLGASLVPRIAIAALVPRIGILGDTPGRQWETFRKTMADLGYVEGSTVAFESRYSHGISTRFGDLAAELVSSGVQIIVTEGGVATAAAKKATDSIPIVMTIVADPVGSGLVAGLAHPGGNVTGSTSLAFDLTAKQLQLLKELIPALANVAFVWDPNQSFHYRAVQEVKPAAQALAVQLIMVEARTMDDIDRAFQRLSKNPGVAALILPSTTLDAQQAQLAEIARRANVPSLYNKGLFCQAGGLVCFGAKYSDFFTRAAFFVDKILKGTKPADLPIQQPTVFDLSVNLARAKALGITVPSSILGRADQVIE
jgi:putative tryptophan/tyrosine transport system substrate-binding protein